MNQNRIFEEISKRAPAYHMFTRFIDPETRLMFKRVLGSITIILGEISPLSLAIIIDDGRRRLLEGEIKPQKWKNIGTNMILKCKVGYVFLMVLFPMLPHAEIRPNLELSVCN